MKPYLAVLSARYRMLLQYRAAAVAGLLTQLFWGLIRVMIFTAFYQTATTAQPMSIAQVITYVWLTQAMIRILPLTVDPDVREMFRSGAVAYELLRPVDLYRLWYARSLANLTAPTTLRVVPVFLLAGLFLGLQPPASLAATGAWLLATVGAVALACAITTFLCTTLFWTVSGQGINLLFPAGIWFLSGMMIPLPLMPDWAQPVLAALPFRGIMDAPLRLYMGHEAPAEVIAVLAHQLAWIVGFVLMGRLLLLRGTRRLVIQGG